MQYILDDKYSETSYYMFFNWMICSFLPLCLRQPIFSLALKKNLVTVCYKPIFYIYHSVSRTSMLEYIPHVASTLIFSAVYGCSDIIFRSVNCPTIIKGDVKCWRRVIQSLLSSVICLFLAETPMSFVYERYIRRHICLTGGPWENWGECWSRFLLRSCFSF